MPRVADQRAAGPSGYIAIVLALQFGQEHRGRPRVITFEQLRLDLSAALSVGDRQRIDHDVHRTLIATTTRSQPAQRSLGVWTAKVHRLQCLGRRRPFATLAPVRRCRITGRQPRQVEHPAADRPRRALTPPDIGRRTHPRPRYAITVPVSRPVDLTPSSISHHQHVTAVVGGNRIKTAHPVDRYLAGCPIAAAVAMPTRNPVNGPGPAPHHDSGDVRY